MKIYRFSKTVVEGDASMNNILGGKGAGLAEMTDLGFPVPPGFTIPVTEGRKVLETGQLPDELFDSVVSGVKWLEEQTGHTFGCLPSPMLLAVRSGAHVFMPGQMDTVLNVGMTQEVVDDMSSRIELSKLSGMWNSLREELGGEYEPWQQLRTSLLQIFLSWNNERAKEYRRLHGMDDYAGTPATIQFMVFGNRGDTSGAGVAFSHNLETGEQMLNGEWLSDDQGEAVVLGTRTPGPITDLGKQMPGIYDQLQGIVSHLFKIWDHPVDCEYTVEDGKLWILQAMKAQLTPGASVKLAVKLATDGRIEVGEALNRVAPAQLSNFFVSKLADPDEHTSLAKGLASSPGAVAGKVALSSAKAVEMAKAGSVVLVSEETSPDDMPGIVAAQGVLTGRGGVSSHAAIVTRNIGKPSVVGCAAVQINGGASCLINDERFFEGDWITVDGSTGLVYKGELPIEQPTKEPPELTTLLQWSEEIRDLSIRVFCGSGEQAKIAAKHDVNVVLPTEYTFLGERADMFREAILADKDDEKYLSILREIAAMQVEDYSKVFSEIGSSGWVMVRLLDPPLHEFLPKADDDFERLAVKMRVPVNQLRRRAEAFSEGNPMLGHRGCRLGINRPEIYRLQVKAMAQAMKESPIDKLQILVPLVVGPREMKQVSDMVNEKIGNMLDRSQYQIGAMIETPRACLLAGEIAELSDFLVIGTSDLTQAVWCYSRDDTSFLEGYLKQGTWARDPASFFDQRGVGELVAMSIERARSANSNIPIEMVVDETSVEWFQKTIKGQKAGIICTIPQIRSMQLLAAQACMRSQ